MQRSHVEESIVLSFQANLRPVLSSLLKKRRLRVQVKAGVDVLYPFESVRFDFAGEKKVECPFLAKRICEPATLEKGLNKAFVWLFKNYNSVLL